MSESSRCTKCGTAFRCGVEAGDERCWCVDYPKIRPEIDATSCLCPDCLAAVVEHYEDRGGPENSPTDAAHRQPKSRD